MKFIKKYSVTIILITGIFYACMMHSSDLPKVSIPAMDKYIHFSMFFVLSIIVGMENTGWLKKKISASAFFLSMGLLPLVYGGLIELAQEYFSPTRTGDWDDFFFDFLGILFSCLIFLIISKMKKEKSHPLERR